MNNKQLLLQILKDTIETKQNKNLFTYQFSEPSIILPKHTVL